MRPISTKGTDIDEVLILRGRRIGAQERQNFSKASARKAMRDSYLDFLRRNPVRETVILRFVNHLRSLFANVDLDENDVLTKGYF